METLSLPDLSDVPIEQLDGARLLGLPRDPVVAVREGLPFSAFEQVQAVLGIPAHSLAEALHVAPRTLSRRRAAGRLAPDESDRLLRLARLVEMALVVFEEPGAAAAWFTSPRKLLSGESPLLRADTAHGAREVEDMLFAIEFNAAA